MKYLYNFAALDKSLALACLKTARTGDVHQEPDRKTIIEINAKIHKALVSKIESVAYFRKLMDGWNNTAYALKNVSPFNSPEMASRWNGFLQNGISLVDPSSALLNAFPKDPSCSTIRSMTAKLGLGAYAGNAFIYAINDCVQFVKATKCAGIATMLCLGASMNDEEYSP